MKYLINAANMLLLLAVSIVAAPLSGVRMIHVGDMGKSDEAGRFRLLVESSLSKQGFKTTQDAAEADAILTGVLIVRVFDDGTVARVTASLRDRDGSLLWTEDFGPRYNPLSFWRREPVQLRADDFAKALRRAVTKTPEK